MLSKPSFTYQRPQAAELHRRLTEPRRFLQAVTGPRQVGKTIMVHQVAQALDGPVRFASADEPTLRGTEWLHQQWESARLTGGLLVIDEIQKVPAWSEAVKRLWDEDTNARRDLKVVLLGSAPLLVQRGLTESLAGRFETLHLPHWSFAEMREAFAFSLDQFVYYGGYPGAASLIGDPGRWRHYILDALIETTIARDVLLMTRIDKPALLRRLFELACRYSGQVLSFTKMLGQLQDAGNTTTLAHYLDLLSAAGLVTGLQKFTGAAVRSRASSPKLQVRNTALMSAMLTQTLEEVRADAPSWGRHVESAVGAHLANAAATREIELFYWRERSQEVDFVARTGKRVVAIEVKSSQASTAHSGTRAFREAFSPHRSLLVGGDGIPLEEFLGEPVSRWTRP